MHIMNATSKMFPYYVLSPLALKLLMSASQVSNKRNNIVYLNGNATNIRESYREGLTWREPVSTQYITL